MNNVIITTMEYNKLDRILSQLKICNVKIKISVIFNTTYQPMINKSNSYDEKQWITKTKLTFENKATAVKIKLKYF